MNLSTRSVPQRFQIGNRSRQENPHTGDRLKCPRAPARRRSAAGQFTRPTSRDSISSSDAGQRTVLQIGQEFNPYGRFIGALVPTPILRNSEISPSEKLVLARLIQYSGDNGRAWPRIETLAAEVGLGTRQVQKCLKELESNHLIERREAQGGRHKSSVFTFLWSALYDAETPHDRSPFTPQKREQKLVVSSPERVNDRSRNGELLFAERVNDRSPRISSIEVIHEESSVRASDSESWDSPPARLTDSHDAQFSAFAQAADSEGKEPQAQYQNCPSPPSLDEKPVIEVLEECGIKIPDAGIAAQLLELAAEQHVGPPGLIAFIRYKAKTRHVEIATFFRQAIPEDLRTWAARNGWLRPRQVAPESAREGPREISPFCAACGDTGHVQIPGNERVSTPDGFCSCIPGQLSREDVEPVYSVSRSPCPQCLSTLRVQTAAARRRNAMATCAFCEPIPDFGQSEKPTDAALRLAAAEPAEKCPVCEWDRYAKRNTGIIKADWLTENSTASYCPCRWGEYASSVNSPDYLDRISRAERAIARRERESGQVSREQQLVSSPLAMARPAAAFADAVEQNRARCPDCGMQPGEGFRVVVESGVRIMQPCICTLPGLAAHMRRATERVRQHRRTETSRAHPARHDRHTSGPLASPLRDRFTVERFREVWQEIRKENT